MMVRLDAMVDGHDATMVGLDAMTIRSDTMAVRLQLGLCIPVKSSRYPNLVPTPWPAQP